VYACVHMYVCVCACVNMHICVCASTRGRIVIFSTAAKGARVYVYACVHMCVCARVCEYACMCMNMCEVHVGRLLFSRLAAKDARVFTCVYVYAPVNICVDL
jgi:hypothetical protein